MTQIVNLQRLLNEVLLIKKKNDEILDATGGRFNMFRVVGVNHYENTHSAILAELLDPEGTHGLKSEFLKLFLKTILPDNVQFAFECDRAKVRTEYTTKEGRIDIFIENEGKTIIIENKIYAGDQPEQLKRYNRFAEVKFKGKENFLLLYLTLFGSTASEQSGGGVEYLPISYEINIINWLEECTKTALRYPTIRETLIQYINHLKQLTNQDMDTENSKEIVNVLLRKENIKAAMLIIDNQSEFKKSIIEQFLEKNLQAIANELELQYRIEQNFYNGAKYSGFSFTKGDWETLSIRFAFNSNSFQGFYWGLSGKKKYTEAEQQKMAMFNNVNAWWPYGWKWHSKYRNWNNNTFIDIYNGQFSEEIKKNVKQVLQVIKGTPNLKL